MKNRVKGAKWILASFYVLQLTCCASYNTLVKGYLFSVDKAERKLEGKVDKSVAPSSGGQSAS